MSGTVYLVGAGPGAADLLTLRAANLLARAEIVFHDALVPPGILALAGRARLVAVGKRCGRHSTAQKFINKRLADAARSHAVVVRLKGGDPMLFGRAQEEIAHLCAAGIRVEVVPGVTAALAASAELGLSLTRRGLSRSVVFVTPRAGDGEPENAWARAVLAADTAGIYMGAGQAGEIARALIGAGMERSRPLAVVENASLPESRQVFGTLGELEQIARFLQSGAGGPILILVGEICRQAVIRRELPREEVSAAVGTRAAGLSAG
jgi:uroporphyrin-III C-methyltransferase